jgi:cytochrome c
MSGFFWKNENVGPFTARRFLFYWFGLFALLVMPAHGFDRHTAHGGPVRGLALSPDGSTLVTASFDYSAVVWGARGLDERTTLLGHDAAVNTAGFSADGSLLATAGDDGAILLWDVEQLQQPTVTPIILRGHKGKVVDLAFSRDGSTLASASWDGSIGIWPLAGAAVDETQSARFITGHEGPVNAVQFSDDGEFLYSAGYDGQVRYWRLATNEYLRSPVRNGWGVSTFIVDEPADVIAFGGSDGQMVVQRLSDETALLQLGDERVPVLSLFYNPDDGLIGFGNAKGRVVLIDTSDWSVVRDFNAANGPIWSLVIMPGAEHIIVAGLDDFITRWPILEFPPEFLERPGPARRFHPTKNIGNGERQFARKCSVCHTLNLDGKRRAGPTLFGVFGRQAGTLEGYTYSDALLQSTIVWDADSIDRLFKDGPDVVTPGTKMPIQRMKNAQDRHDLVSFLQSATKTP